MSAGDGREGRKQRQFPMGRGNGGVQERVVIYVPKNGPSRWLATLQTL